MENIEIFEKWAEKYDEWFERNRFVYESELNALRKFAPKAGNGIEVGVGTGRFAVPLGIRYGVEPAKSMAEIARKRGIKVYDAKGEELPFDDESFDFLLMVTTVCFLQNPFKAFQEATRVLKREGHIVIGMIDRDSPIGKLYESKKKDSRFYRHANFYSVSEVLKWLERLRYREIKICQTIFNNPKEINAVEPVKDGYGDGGFIVISGQKGE
jgi:ubiquinone/menaquinone biosynthesis C-methylase UbiE